jgi:hypothetical protein
MVVVASGARDASNAISPSRRRRRFAPNLVRHPPESHLRQPCARIVRQSLVWPTGGVPVHIFPSCTYEEGLVQLRPGDLIIAYTDGVTEAANPAGEINRSRSSSRCWSSHCAGSIASI